MRRRKFVSLLGRAPACYGWEAPMLQKLNKEIAECYEHAVECRRRADESSDPGSSQLGPLSFV
jgi:hypothetical protein